MKIIKVFPDSLGETIGIQPGDRLLKINGKRVQDEIDYQFRMTEEVLTLDFEISGRMEKIEIEKEYDDDLGVEFEEMKIRSCANNCVFCFVDQNPPEMRKGMYFRDGDYRMSYLHGHYITMTNMGQNELNRVVEQRLSPLYISVHVTDIEQRQKLFLYKKDDGLLAKLEYLTNNGIELHTQIVLMPDLNDGEFLNKTLEDLYHYYPSVKSCTIVPVGLTGHRKGLMEIKSANKKYAENLLNGITRMRDKFSGKKSPFVLYSDEWFILAEQPFPPLSDYGELDLAENGVGQVRQFLTLFEEESANFPRALAFETNITLATGTLVYETFQKEVIPILNQIDNLTVTLLPIINKFYGESVTVTGLLTGTDIITQLASEDLGDAVWMSHRIINDEGTLTLDNLTLDDISNAIDCPLQLSNDSFLTLLNNLTHA
jgi:putative radical SAM enzyme (TIGR03279 family)